MTKQVDWLGRVLADGRYRIVDKLGEGSMGLVYRAYDSRLETEIVMKVPLGSALDDPDFVERFNREIRSLVRLTHPHVVKIIDVGTEDEIPYVVMQYLSGGSLKDRINPRGSETYAMPQESLNDWLLEVAKALDFMHGQSYLHRDVKPANILFDEYGNAFLGDFGLSKAMTTAKEMPSTGASLTAAGFLVGTPNYVAPEVVMGSPYDGHIDQYSLAMTVYEALTGKAPLEGPTASATMVNQTNKAPPSLSDANSAISPGLSAAVLKGLAKQPQRRYDNCVSLAQAVLAEVQAERSSGSGPRRGAVSKGEAGRIACPACRKVLPIKPEYAGKQARCAQCQAVLQISADATELKLVLVTPAAAAQTAPSPPVPSQSRSRVTSRPSERQEKAAASDSARSQQAETVTAPEPRGRLPAPSKPRKTTTPKPAVGKSPRRPDKPAGPVQLYGLARVVGYLSIAAVLTISFLMLNAILGDVESRKSKPVVRIGEARASAENDASPSSEAAAAVPAPADAITTSIHVACSPENHAWLEAAAKAFQGDPAGRHITITLQPVALTSGASAILQGPGAAPIQAWAPESALYAGILEQEWRLKHPAGPVLRSQELLRSPMVFVMWKQRLEPFLEKYPELNFTTIAQALQEPGGWGRIADKPDWGNFDFAHADPLTSNSGALALILMAQEHARSQELLDISRVTDAKFQKMLQDVERSLKRTEDVLPASSSALLDDMLLRGVNEYDCIFVEEAVALRALSAAPGPAAELQLVSPPFNVWNTFPFYVLDVPWSSKAQQGAASQFLSFLARKPMQAGALSRGFRPADAAVSLDRADSPESPNPFARLSATGLRIDVPRACELPPGDVVRELLGSARRLSR